MGQVVGRWYNPNGQGQTAFLWDNETIIDLGTLFPDDFESVAMDVNNHGMKAFQRASVKMRGVSPIGEACKGPMGLQAEHYAIMPRRGTIFGTLASPVSRFPSSAKRSTTP